MILKRVDNVLYVDFQTLKALDQSENEMIEQRIADLEYILPMLTSPDELQDKYEILEELALLKQKANEISILDAKPLAKVIQVDFIKKCRAA